MTKLPPCNLSMRDFNVLEEILNQVAHDPSYFRLLRQKLTDATIVRDGADGHPTASIGSRVDFVINNQVLDSRILSAAEPAAPIYLPITTLRGLALLGLPPDEVISVANEDGQTETLRIRNIYPDRSSHQGAFFTAPDGDDDPGPQAA